MLMACHTPKKTQDESPAVVKVQFNADSAYQFCQQQCDFGPRVMNSEAHERCAQWIAQKFQQYGYEVTLQKADLKGYDGTILKSTNIIATAPSKDSEDKTRLLLCAHWDSRPWADNDLARLIQMHDSLNVAVDFVCFDAEDWGAPQWTNKNDADSWALGAQHWAASFNAQSSTPNYQYAILLDMVGGQGAKFYHEAFSLDHARPIVEKVWQAAAAAGYGSFFPSQTGGYVTDDHVPVNEVAHIPCIDIINHYPDCPQSSFGPTWHTINDDMPHLDKNTLQAVGQTLVQVLFSE